MLFCTDTNTNIYYSSFKAWPYYDFITYTRFYYVITYKLVFKPGVQSNYVQLLHSTLLLYTSIPLLSKEGIII